MTFQLTQPRANYDKTDAWLEEHNLWDSVRINFCVHTLPVSMPCYWISPARCKRVEKSYHLKAYIGLNHTLAFRNMRLVEKRERKPMHRENGASNSAQVKADKKQVFLIKQTQKFSFKVTSLAYPKIGPEFFVNKQTIFFARWQIHTKTKQ